jgi:SPOR domain
MMRLIHRLLFSTALVLILFGLAGAQAASYTVQFAAAPTREEAEEKVQELKAKNVIAYIVKGSVPGRGVFYRVRAGIFSNQNDAKKFGSSLQQRGVVSEYFITAYEKPADETAASAAPKGAPLVKVASKTNQAVSNNPPGNNPPVNSSAASSVSVTGAPINPAPNPATNPAPNSANNPGLNPSVAGVPVATPSGFLKYQDPKTGFSFDYPNYWMGQPLSDKEASEQRMSAGAVFTSQRDAAFLYTVWNELDKANNPANENDLIVEIILRSMSSGNGTKLEETARRVEARNGLIKTYLDFKAAFQTQGQSAPLDFLGKAVIVRASRGIMLVVTFYSKDSPPNAEIAADMIIASVRPPE